MSDEKGLPKPEPAAGQRWRTVLGEEITLTERAAWDEDGWHDDRLSPVNSLWAHALDKATFLGWADGYGPKAKAPVMAEDACAFPVSCLGCGGAKGGCPFVCEACFPGWSQYGQRLVDAWEDGARDFPRPRTREITATAPITTEAAKSPPSASQGPQDAQWIAQAGKYSMQWADSMAARILGLHYRAMGSAPMRVYLTSDEFVVPYPPAAPTRYEISVNGRDVLQYERLTDPDPVESYPYWRAAGSGAIGMGWDERSPALVAARKRVEWVRHSAVDVDTAAKMRRERRTTIPPKPAPEPWRPSVLEEDLLCEDAER